MSEEERKRRMGNQLCLNPTTSLRIVEAPITLIRRQLSVQCLLLPKLSRLQANLKKVLDQLKELEESGNGDRAVPGHGELITAYELYPFAYDGSKLTEDGQMPESEYNINNFTL
jgi:hypothetical protein